MNVCLHLKLIGGKFAIIVAMKMSQSSPHLVSSGTTYEVVWDIFPTVYCVIYADDIYMKIKLFTFVLL